eukprot:6664096-Prymnesium_polylepis.1
MRRWRPKGAEHGFLARHGGRPPEGGGAGEPWEGLGVGTRTRGERFAWVPNAGLGSECRAWCMIAH